MSSSLKDLRRAVDGSRCNESEFVTLNTRLLQEHEQQALLAVKCDSLKRGIVPLNKIKKHIHHWASGNQAI